MDRQYGQPDYAHVRGKPAVRVLFDAQSFKEPETPVIIGSIAGAL